MDIYRHRFGIRLYVCYLLTGLSMACAQVDVYSRCYQYVDDITPLLKLLEDLRRKSTEDVSGAQLSLSYHTMQLYARMGEVTGGLKISTGFVYNADVLPLDATFASGIVLIIMHCRVHEPFLVA